jgi:hypothetical protein
MSHDDDLIAQIVQHAGFPALTERVNTEIARRKALLVTMLLGTDAPVDQRAVDKQRGVIEGVELFLREAKRGARAFERDKDGETV